jgi:glycerophosphoryl diester phosphodiesterase
MNCFVLCSCQHSKDEFSGYTPSYEIRKHNLISPLDKHPIEVVVHRGANHLAPENTYAAAAKAIEMGVDYVEVDVHKSLDGVHYIIHDFSLGRTTDGWGPIRFRTSAYIDQLDAGSWFGADFTGEPVPRLSDYLRWINGKSRVYLDVKNANLEEVVKMIRDLEMENEVFFWFWNDQMAAEFRKVAPDLRLKINASTPEEVRTAKDQFNANIIECNVSEITNELKRTCDKLDIKIMAYASTNSRTEFEAVISSQADKVNLDRPYLYMEVLDSLHEVNKLSLSFPE